MNAQEMILKIENILNETLKGFYIQVFEYSVLGSKSIGIKMSTANALINNVSGQYPDIVSLRLDSDFELKPQVFGGCGGQCFYRKPDRNNDREKYLAMASVKVPFRMPQKNEVAVLKAIKRFAENYKALLKENYEKGNLRCAQYGSNYETLLG